MDINILNIILIIGATIASIAIVYNTVGIILKIVKSSKNNKEFKRLESKSCKIHNWANHMNIKFCTDCGKVYNSNGYMPEAQRKAASTIAIAREKYKQANKKFKQELAAEYNLTTEQFEEMATKYAKFKVDFQINLINELNPKK